MSDRDVKPTASETTVIGGDGMVYKTRTEAQGGMRTATVCTSNSGSKQRAGPFVEFARCFLQLGGTACIKTSG